MGTEIEVKLDKFKNNLSPGYIKKQSEVIFEEQQPNLTDSDIDNDNKIQLTQSEDIEIENGY
ncbi:hypothetical protein OCHUTO_0161 [Orientia chuto str. Dubai]|uniref:Uncharacterized protein n=1 Tax=Orientia chuto str. Dubai TaxID=1359168 RepID=A0A0F3MP21_9RICK|nr:hypothetical protein [Candidatus Orientia mediorientalis]KJV57187.1 hypothetical protein OCHUTO_0161 [Orientia chuto str. Dubai]